MSLVLLSMIASPSFTAHIFCTRMFSLVAMSLLRHSSLVSLTSNTMTACDCFSLCRNRRRGVDQRATELHWDPSTGSFNCTRTDWFGFWNVIPTSVSLPHVAENQKYFSSRWMRWSAQCAGRSPH